LSSLYLRDDHFTCSAELNYYKYDTHQVTCWAGLWSRASSDGSSREVDCCCCCWKLLIWTQTLSTQTTLDHHWPVIITISTVCQLTTLTINHTRCPDNISFPDFSSGDSNTAFDVLTTHPNNGSGPGTHSGH